MVQQPLAGAPQHPAMVAAAYKGTATSADRVAGDLKSVREFGQKLGKYNVCDSKCISCVKKKKKKNTICDQCYCPSHWQHEILDLPPTTVQHDYIEFGDHGGLTT